MTASIARTRRAARCGRTPRRRASSSPAASSRPTHASSARSSRIATATASRMPDEPGVPDVHAELRGRHDARQRPRRQVQLLRPHADDACPPRRSDDAAGGRRIDDEQQSQRGQRRQSLHRSEVWRSPSRGLHRGRRRESGGARGDWRPARARQRVWVPSFDEPARAGDHRWPAGDRERRNRPSGCGRCADAADAGPDDRRIRTDPAGGRPQPGELECAGAVTG